MPDAYHRYGHFTAGNGHNDWLVTDGYYHPEGVPENSNWGGRMDQPGDGRLGETQDPWTGLCQHESFWDCQDSHPHPIFDHADRFIYFTSNKAGSRSVYRVAVPLTPMG